MSVEQNKIIETVASKARRLPKGVRRHIRTLKQEGSLEEVVRFGREQRAKKAKAFNIKQALDMAVTTIVDSDDKKEIGVAVLEASFASSVANGESADERNQQIEEVFELFSDVPSLEKELVGVRDRIAHLPNS